MSGGPVFSAHGGLPNGDQSGRSLVGIAIEHRKGVLIAIRVGVLFDAIRVAFPHLSEVMKPLPPWLSIMPKVQMTAGNHGGARIANSSTKPGVRAGIPHGDGPFFAGEVNAAGGGDGGIWRPVAIPCQRP